METDKLLRNFVIDINKKRKKVSVYKLFSGKNYKDCYKKARKWEILNGKTLSKDEKFLFESSKLNLDINGKILICELIC